MVLKTSKHIETRQIYWGGLVDFPPLDVFPPWSVKTLLNFPPWGFPPNAPEPPPPNFLPNVPGSGFMVVARCVEIMGIAVSQHAEPIFEIPSFYWNRYIPKLGGVWSGLVVFRLVWWHFVSFGDVSFDLGVFRLVWWWCILTKKTGGGTFDFFWGGPRPDLT